jgi:hypothetical protein
MTASDFQENLALPRAALLTLAALCVPPLSALAAVTLLHGEPAGMAGLWTVPMVAATLAFVLWPNRIVVRDGELRLRAGLIRHRIALAQLQPDLIDSVDLDTAPALRPRWRIFGTGLPGPFQAGWFGLQGGGRAFVLLNRRSDITRLRFRDGTLVLLSLRDGERFRRALGAVSRG